MGERLWDIDTTPVPSPRLSPDVRRRMRYDAQIARGFHPSGLGRIDREHVCGTCAHCVPNAGHARTYWKCDRTTMTAGPGTDIRKSWPACGRWEGET